ncbi:hypothetical protein L0U88_19520 [Flavihumibacter sp. RY-1]|uniref:Restriction endonuclease n=1 Tax=Flavihumibacter fluminis TaxID=2909236 RepID=A0ABS9BM89_9BACT|nr:hypothetical protein [Flavihumibacter fluminis]MCF1716841.1 hypothetical protein [Flavihumibacter fluminis]
MQASKSLRRPTNWQDFETLCKKLWGEIWNCAEIKKNGRPGQLQHGVDIYGIPKGEIDYFGIQCKGKDEYTDKQFSEEEIDKEIENARHFKPALKKLYFATTAVKDAKIEAYVRQKNVEHLTNQLFEVHLFSWEDIVDLIDENKETHDWYIKSQNFKSRKEIKITFEDDALQLNSSVVFVKTITDKRQNIVPASGSFDSFFTGLGRQSSINNFSVVGLPDFQTNINLSFFGFRIKILNSGSEPIEDYVVTLDIIGDIQDLSETNESGGMPFINTIHTNINLEPSNNRIKINPKKPILVGDDILLSDTIFIKPKHDKQVITLKWKLLSKDFKDTGQLFINVDTHIEVINRTELVEDPFEVGIVEGAIEDCVLPKEEPE